MLGPFTPHSVFIATGSPSPPAPALAVFCTAVTGRSAWACAAGRIWDLNSGKSGKPAVWLARPVLHMVLTRACLLLAVGLEPVAPE